MVLHLGGDISISSKKIIAILDVKTINSPENSFLKNQKVTSIYISDDSYKSIVITASKGRHRIYYSPISAATLCKRSAFINDSIL